MSQSSEHLLDATLALPEADRVRIGEALLASVSDNGGVSTNGKRGADASRSSPATEHAAGEEEKVNRIALITLANWRPPLPLPPTPDPPKYQWPADVWEFAVRHQVAGYLDPMRDAVQRNFPNAEDVGAYIEGDPEIPEEWHVVFSARLRGQRFPGPDLDNVQAARKRYFREARQFCPAPLICIFRLSLDYVD